MLLFFKEVFSHFSTSNTFQKGAALAYYAVFSLLPMIVIIVSLFGIFFGQQAVSGEVYVQLKDALGDDAATQIQDIIKHQHLDHNSKTTSIIGIATLALSASGMFSQVHNAFNNIWNIKAKPKNSILKYFTKHLSSFLILTSIFLIILISTSISSLLTKHAQSLHEDYTLLYLYEHIFSLLILSIAFMTMFKFLGDAKVYWKSALYGGIFTAVLFLFGKVGIAKYIAHSHVSSTFGSASVLAVLMLWVYYTSQIIFLGASFVKVISERLHREILPNANAVRIEKHEIHA